VGYSLFVGSVPFRIIDDEVQIFLHIVYLVAFDVNFVAAGVQIFAELFLGDEFFLLLEDWIYGVNSDPCFLERCL
jgi:hypothetical protein